MPIWKPSQRESVATLLDPQAPIDATTMHYALAFAADRVQLLVHRRPGHSAINGFIARVRVAQDRSKPEMIVMRAADEAAASALFRASLPAGKRVFLQIPSKFAELVRQTLAVEDAENHLLLMHPDHARLPEPGEPPPGLRVRHGEANNGSPMIEMLDGDRHAAYAGLNWMNEKYGELRAETAPEYRGRGLAPLLVAMISRQLVESGRTPLYYVAESNAASRRMAVKLGYEETGLGELMGHVVLPLAVPAGLAGLVRY